MTTTNQSFIVEEPGNGTLEIFPLQPDEAALTALMTELFRDHWDKIHFGPLIQGAVFEIKVTQPPQRIGMLDGYLTVDFGVWHFHLCIGEHKGSKTRPVDPELARHRRTGRAEFYRRLNPDGTVGSWGIRLFNGKGENQIYIFLPNPFLTDEMKFRREPDWSRLELWDDLRQRYLGLPPDPKDRSGRTMFHG
ncbi:MAG TPA: hypothetical protein DEF43_08530 [Chloroflexus aurantiacus]|jgi:hypothetical protein|uniref:Uncharacterized protein n=1 Tax=Chloroflexus aurantiacus (strain ATCC 29366 / DSM 635 / J-10-fl) TaxID=324602 RepID=A9WCZ8_CHLAA|nr:MULTISPECIES: hypothetical protein [Chloroflexus]ABY33567.1 conserved hypothetical protein [Chloroflexus aurantiacus J-10-fl]RMG52226.1 MAG: hypothetical protein D6716_04015 [Chloroflexota bacterium]HBW67192.1 hypothetical protein [Chloroflexus aurantiacus]